MLMLVLLAGSFGAPLIGLCGTSATELVTVTTSGTAGGGQLFDDPALYEHSPSKISADHRYVVFASASDQLVPNDVNARQDVFVRDRQTGTMSIVSRASDGTQANDHSGAPVISASGRYVAFVSRASNLIPGDANSTFDVFVHDLQTGVTALVSVSSGGAQANYGASHPVISADGRYIAFASFSDSLVPGDTNRFNSDIFVRDITLGTTERISLRPDGSEIVGADSVVPSISADGRRIAFAVYDNTLGGPTPQIPPNLHHGIYVRDLNTNETILVSTRPDGTPSDLLVSLNPMISANGRYVVFDNWEDLDPNFPDSAEEELMDGPFADVFVRDLQTATTRRVSLPFPGGPAEESGGAATISADGRYVAYGGDRVRDLVAGRTTLMTAPGGAPPDGPLDFQAISEDGRLVYFESGATNLVPNDSNGLIDVFLYSMGPLADLSLTLQASSLQPHLNAELTFTVVVTNSGPDDAMGVEVRAPLPAGVTFVSDTGGGRYASATGVWTVGGVAAGPNATLQIVGRFTAASPVAVTAQVSASSHADPDSTPDNDNPTEDDQQTVELTPALADLSLGLIANTAVPPVNSNVTFTISVTNAGPGGAAGVAARIPLPAGLTFVSASPAAAYNAANGIWTLGSLPKGATLALDLVARVTSAAPIDLTAQVSASSEPDPDSTPNNDNPAEDDQQTVRLTPLLAAGIIVNDATMVVDPNDGKCTLIEAIIAANTDVPSGNAIGECAGGSGPDTIHLRALNAPKDVPGIRDEYRVMSVHNGLDGPNGLPSITSAITIEGGGADIKRTGAPAFRLFHVGPTGRLTLNNLAVTGGRLTSPTPGAPDSVGGGLLNLGTLELNNGWVAANQASYAGGGIASFGPLAIRQSSLLFNTSGGSGGGIWTFYAGALTLIDTTLQYNTAPNGSGGGLMIHGTTTATLTNSVVDQNSAMLDGGGLLAHGADANVSLTNTRVTNNAVTAGHGGGIANGRLQTDYTGKILVPGGTITITGSLVSLNRATGGHGAGVANAGLLTLTSSTISGNQLAGTPGLACGGGLYSAASLTLVGATVTGNTATGGGSGGGLCAVDSTMTIANTVVTENIAGNGGGLFALRSSLILDNSVVQQNRADALAGGGVRAFGGSLSLQNNTRVLGNTAATAGGGIAIEFAIATPTTVTITGGLIDGNTANGSWPTWGGGGGLANLDVNGAGSVRLNGVIISNNRAPSGGDGGGIFNRGTLLMTGGELRGNSALSGGGLANGTGTLTGGTATLTNVAIENNTAPFFGGGISNFTPAGSSVTSAVTLTGSTVRNNRATGTGANEGGGIVNGAASSLTVQGGSVIDGNTAGTSAGGIRNDGTLILDMSTVSNNSADIGGAIYTGGPATITGSTLSGNTADRVGAIRIVAGATTTITNSTLSGNTAMSAGGGAIDVSGTANLDGVTIAGNTGMPGGISSDGRVVILNSIIAGNQRPDAAFSECTGLTGSIWQIGRTLVGADPGCFIAAPHPTGKVRTVNPADVFTQVLGPLAANGGPTATHALLPGSIAIDAGDDIAPCPSTDQRGDPRPADGDGDGTAPCDVGAYEQQTPLQGPQAALASLDPQSALAGSGDTVATVSGTGFVAGSVAYWNGTPRATFVRSPTDLAVTLLASDLSTAAEISTGLITVLNPGTDASNPLPFTIVSATVTRVQSVIVPPGASGTASALPTLAGQHGVSATLTNNDPASSPATVSVATHSANPAGGTIFAAGGFFDLQVTGADPSDSVAARFYYPSTVTGAVEAGLQLRFWTGTAWAPVIGSGGSPPAKDTTNNLDGTVSGGRFAVTLDGTSTPAITALSGTVFAIATTDTTPPTTVASISPSANARGWHNTDVVVTLAASDNVGAVTRTEFDLDGIGWRPYTVPIALGDEGIHHLRFRSQDASGNLEAPQTLKIRVDKTPPLVSATAHPRRLWPPNHKLVDVETRVHVRDALSGADGFTLVSVESSDPDDGRDGRGTDNDIQGWTPGTPDTHGKLRAELSSHARRRVYTLTYRGIDRAGNSAVATLEVHVAPPHAREDK
jgi:uncharacterized repeat protein (TIGR01451 family)